MGAGPGGRPCNLFNPRTLTGAPVPALDLYESGHAGVRHEVDQLRAQRRHRLAAERARAGSCARCWAIPSRPPFAPATRSATTRSASTASKTASARTPAATSTWCGTTRRAIRWSAQARATRSSSVSAAVSARRVFPDVAGLSDRGDDRRQRGDVQAGSADAARALLLDRIPAVDRPGHGGRGSLPRQPEPVHVGRGELERAQHHRERLPRRVREGPGQPARQPGGDRAPRRSPTRASPARSRCRPIWRTSAAGRRQRTRRPTRRRSSPTRRSSRGSARSSPTCCNAAQDLDTTAFRANAARAGFVAEPLRHEPGRHQRERRRGPELDEVRQHAARSAAASVGRPAGVGQLHLRRPQGRRQPVAALRSAAGGHDRRPARVQGELGVPDSRRPRPAFRHRHERHPRWADRRLGVLRQRAIPEPALPDSSARSSRA